MGLKVVYCCFSFLLFAFTSEHVAAQIPEGQALSNYRHRDSSVILRDMVQADSIQEKYPDSAVMIFKNLLQESQRQQFYPGVMKLLFRLGNIASRQAFYEEASVYYLLALRFCDTARYRKNMVELYTNLGNTYRNQGKPEAAYRSYYKAMVLAGYHDGELAGAYSNMAIIHADLNQPEQARAYLDQAISHALGPDDFLLRTILHINKGLSYYDQKAYGQAAPEIDTAIFLARKYKLYQQLGAALVADGLVLMDCGDPEQALVSLLEAKTLSNEQGMPVHARNSVISTIGEVYLKLGNYPEAEKYLLQASRQQNNIPQEKLYVLNRLARLYAANGRHQEAYETSERYHNLKDSIQGAQVSLRVHDMETRYRTAEKDKVLVRNELELTRRQVSLRQARLWMAGGFICSLLLLFLLYSLRRNARQKQNQLVRDAEMQLLEAAISAEEKERLRIATELHDGIVSELTAVKMTMAAAGPETRGKEYYDQIEEQLSMAIEDIRNTAHNLMPEILLRYNLAQAISLFCETVHKTGRLHIEFQEYGDFSQLGMGFRQSIYRIVQELIHNIIKHARATHALVQLSCNNGLLTVAIEDNGIGIDLYKKKDRRGMGTVSMEKRVRSLNGKIEWHVESAGESQGTNVYLEFEILPDQNSIL